MQIRYSLVIIHGVGMNKDGITPLQGIKALVGEKI